MPPCADKAGVQPLLGDALELTEEMKLRLFAGIAPLGVEQVRGEVVSTVEGRMSLRCSTVRLTPSPMMPEFCVLRRADQLRRQIQNWSRR